VTERFLTKHILYAADLDHTRVVVGWDPEDGGLGKVTMSAGPRGGAADRLGDVSSAAGGDTDLVVLRESDDNDSRVVALTTPGTRRLSLSTGVQISTDGAVARNPSRAVARTDGVYTSASAARGRTSAPRWNRPSARATPTRSGSVRRTSGPPLGSSDPSPPRWASAPARG
jgi:hypothetical protein